MTHFEVVTNDSLLVDFYLAHVKYLGNVVVLGTFSKSMC